MDDRTRTAYHEAAHVIVAKYFMWYVEKATIKANGEFKGRALAAYTGDISGKFNKNQAIRQEMIILQAGFLGELLFDPDNADNEVGPSKDRYEVVKLHSQYKIRSKRANDERYRLEYLDKQMKETYRLVLKLRPAISLVAEELLKRETITGEKLEELCKVAFTRAEVELE